MPCPRDGGGSWRNSERSRRLTPTPGRPRGRRAPMPEIIAAASRGSRTTSTSPAARRPSSCRAHIRLADGLRWAYARVGVDQLGRGASCGRRSGDRERASVEPADGQAGRLGSVRGEGRARSLATRPRLTRGARRTEADTPLRKMARCRARRASGVRQVSLYHAVSRCGLAADDRGHRDAGAPIAAAALAIRAFSSAVDRVSRSIHEEMTTSGRGRQVASTNARTSSDTSSRPKTMVEIRAQAASKPSPRSSGSIDLIELRERRDQDGALDLDDPRVPCWRHRPRRPRRSPSAHEHGLDESGVEDGLVDVLDGRGQVDDAASDIRRARRSTAMARRSGSRRSSSSRAGRHIRRSKVSPWRSTRGRRWSERPALSAASRRMLCPPLLWRSSCVTSAIQIVPTIRVCARSCPSASDEAQSGPGVVTWLTTLSGASGPRIADVDWL